HCLKDGSVEFLGNIFQFSSGIKCFFGASGGDHNGHCCREELCPFSYVFCFPKRIVYRRFGVMVPTLRNTKQGETRLRVSSPFCGPMITFFGTFKIAKQALQFRFAIKCLTGGRFSRPPCQEFARVGGFLQRFIPFTVKLNYFGPARQTLSSEG